MLSQSAWSQEYCKNEKKNKKLILQVNSLNRGKCMEGHRFKCLLSKDAEKRRDL